MKTDKIIALALLAILLNVSLVVAADNPPNIYINYVPSSNWTTGTYNFSVTATDSGTDNRGLKYINLYEKRLLAPTSLYSSVDCKGGAMCVLQEILGRPDGLYIYTAVTEDLTGHTVEEQVGLGFDPTPPIVNVTGEPGSWTNSTPQANMTCDDGSGTGCDNTSYLLKVYLSDPGSCSTAYGDYDTPPPANIFAHSWICAAAKDVLGTPGFSEPPVEFLVDQNRPVVSVGGWTLGTTWTNNDQTASVDCSDTGGSDCDIGTYALYISSSDPGTCPASYGSYTSGSSQTVSTHQWVCAAGYDIAGNLDFSDTVEEFLVDKLFPNTTYDAVLFPNNGTWANGDQVIDLIPGDQGDSQLAWTRWCLGFGCDPEFGTDYTGAETIPDEGITYFVFSSEDNAGNRMGDVTLSVMIDKAAPFIGFADPTPADSSRQTANQVTVNVSISESYSGLDSCVLEWNGVNESMVVSPDESHCYQTKTTTDGSSYSFSVYVNDTVGWMGWTGVRSFIENSNPVTTGPVITPVNPVTTDNLTCAVNYTDGEGDNGTVYFTWYKNGIEVITNSIMDVVNGTSGVADILTSDNFVKGDNITCETWSNDGFEDEVKENTSVVIQNTPPVITTFPGAITMNTSGGSWVFDYNASDPDVDDGVDVLNWSDNTALFEINQTTGEIFHTPNESEAGVYAIVVTVNDGIAQDNDTFTYTINDSTLPVASIQSPVNSTIYTVNMIGLNYTVTESNLDSCWYNLNGGADQPLNCSEGLNPDNLTLGDGPYNLTVSANDTTGNTGTSELVGFRIDTTPPTVNVNGAPPAWTNQTVQASINCSDSGSGCNVSTYRMYVNLTNPGACPTNYSEYTLVSPQNITNHSWVCAAAVDNTGLVNFSSLTEFLVDKDAPVYGYGVPDVTEDTIGNVTVNITISDSPGAVNISVPVLLYYRYNQSMGYTSTGLTYISGDNWEGVVQEPAGGWDLHSNETMTLYCDGAVDLAGNPANITYYTEPIDFHNDPPVVNLSALNGMTVPEGSYNNSINLSDYVADDWDTPAQITWFCFSNVPNVTVDVNNTTKIMNLTGEGDYVGGAVINCTANDSKGLQDSDIFTVTVTNTNDDPVIQPIPDQTAYTTQLFTYQVNVTDIDGDTGFNFTDNTSVFDIDQNTGLISFIPQGADAGNHTINITVYDGNGGSDSVQFNLEVRVLHDVSVDSIGCLKGAEDCKGSNVTVYLYDNLHVRANVSNQGDVNETVTVNLKDGAIIVNSTVINLSQGETREVVLGWNPGVIGYRTVSVQAAITSAENTSNNQMYVNNVRVWSVVNKMNLTFVNSNSFPASNEAASSTFYVWVGLESLTGPGEDFFDLDLVLDSDGLVINNTQDSNQNAVKSYDPFGWGEAHTYWWELNSGTGGNYNISVYVGNTGDRLTLSRNVNVS